MFAIPAWLGAASRILRRGSIYFLPPIRFNIPVNIHSGEARRVFKIGNSIIHLEEIDSIIPIYEYQWDIPDSDWTTADITDEQYYLMTEKYGDPETRVFAGDLILKDGEVIHLDRKQYWKMQGVLLQIGTEI
jgi:hypothetical protein